MECVPPAAARPRGERGRREPSSQSRHFLLLDSPTQRARRKTEARSGTSLGPPPRDRQHQEWGRNVAPCKAYPKDFYVVVTVSVQTYMATSWQAKCTYYYAILITEFCHTDPRRGQDVRKLLFPPLHRLTARPRASRLPSRCLNVPLHKVRIVDMNAPHG